MKSVRYSDRRCRGRDREMCRDVHRRILCRYDCSSHDQCSDQHQHIQQRALLNSLAPGMDRYEGVVCGAVMIKALPTAYAVSARQASNISTRLLADKLLQTTRSRCAVAEDSTSVRPTEVIAPSRVMMVPRKTRRPVFFNPRHPHIVPLLGVRGDERGLAPKRTCPALQVAQVVSL